MAVARKGREEGNRVRAQHARGVREKGKEVPADGSD